MRTDGPERYEALLGHDLSSVRVHEGPAARAFTKRRGARAVTHGKDIVLGSMRSEAERRRVLAHELVHVVQQRAVPKAGVAEPGSRVVLGTSPAVLHNDEDDIVSVEDWTDVSLEPVGDDIVWYYGDGDLVGLPATDVYRITTPRDDWPVRVPRPREEATPSAPPSAIPGAHWVGVPTVAKEGLRIVRTSSGQGILLDAGGVAYLFPLQRVAELRTTMGISRIEWIALTHPHLDHVRNLTAFITTHRIRADRLILSRDWIEADRAHEARGRDPVGRLACMIRQLRTTTDPTLLALGYGPSWNPGIRFEGEGVARQTIQMGADTVEIVASVQRQREYQRAHRRAGAGRRVPGEVGDSASFIYFLSRGDSSARIANIEDVRLRDFVEIEGQVGRAELHRMFRGVRVLLGFHHHLGAVESTDLDGLRVLLDATLRQNGELTVVVQTREGFRRDALIDTLVELGVRVVSAMGSRTDRPGHVTVNSRQEVTARGGAVETRTGRRAAVRANRTLGDLRAVRQTVLTDAEASIQLISFQPGNHARFLRELDRRIERLESLLRELEAVRTTRLGAEASPGARSTEVIMAEISRIEPAETMIGEDSMRVIRNVRRYGGTFRAEWEHYQRTGRARQALFETMPFVQPALARVLEIDAGGREVRRYQTVEPRATGGVTAAPAGPRLGFRLVGGLMAGIELANATAPAYAAYRRSRVQRGLVENLDRIRWWQEHRVQPVLGAAVDPLLGEATILTDQQSIRRHLDKTVWEHTPSDQRTPEASLEKEVREADELEAVWVSDMPDERLGLFDLWAQLEIRTYDDYAAHFVDVETPAIRHVGASFTRAHWEIHTGHYETSGWNTFEDRWVRHERLTAIMQRVARNVVCNTREALSEHWTQREAEAGEPEPRPGRAEPERPQATLTAGSPSDRGPVRVSYFLDDVLRYTDLRALEYWHMLRPVRRVRFAEGSERRMYAAEDSRHPIVRPSQWWSENPEFFLYDVPWVPEGFVLASGADYNTHGTIRAAQTRTYDLMEVVLIPRPVALLYEALPTRHMSPMQQRAWEDASSGRNGAELVRCRDNRDWEFAVRYWRRAPNEWGLGLLDEDDL